MLRTTSGPSWPLPRRASRIAVPLGAALAAAMLWSAVPRPAAAPAAEPELTAGGKFAARAVVAPVAYDGLDAMPLPRVVPVPAVLLSGAGDGSPAPRRGPDGAASAAPERHARAPRTARVPLRAEPARFAPAPEAVLAAETAPDRTGEEDALHRMMPSWLPRVPAEVAAAARDAWAASASAGDALMSRVLPQRP